MPDCSMSVASDEFETPTDGYGLWNAVVGYRFLALNRVHSVTLRAENLTDALYFDHLSRAKALFPSCEAAREGLVIEL